MTLLPQKPSLVQRQSPLPTLHKMNGLNLEQPSTASLFGQMACSCTRAVYCAHDHSSVHLSQQQSEQRLPKPSTLWLSASAGRGSHCPSPNGLLWIASEIIKFFFAKHSTIELVGYYNGESKWTLTAGGASSRAVERQRRSRQHPRDDGLNYLGRRISGKHTGEAGCHLGPTISHHTCPVSPKSVFITLGSQKSVGEVRGDAERLWQGLGGLLHQTPPRAQSEASGQSKRENRMFL